VKRNAPWLTLFALSLAGVLALDWATGRVGVSIFYLVPIIPVAWGLGEWPAVGAAVVCSSAMFLMEELVERVPQRAIVYWDDVMKVAFLVLFALLLARLREALDREKSLRERLEERVRERTAQLELSSSELQEFNYALAHHLRAPLRSIARLTGLLEGELKAGLSAAQAERFEDIRGSTRRLDAIIEGLLDISSLPVADPRREDVDLSEVARGIVEGLRRTAPERAVRVEIEPGLAVRGERRLLELALRGLLGNAWKFTTDTKDASIELGAKREAGELVYFVRDNGAGFDMAYRAKLFQPFQRLHSPHEYPGLGIGLTLARQVISRHGGRLWAVGTVGGGAAFYFTLPPSQPADTRP
jgi:signal transduction histidine kinase